MHHASRRTLEISTAVAIALAGLLVAAESLSNHGVWWNYGLATPGPEPGYFPFRVGILLIASASVLAVQGLRTGRAAVFVTGAEFRRSLSVFLPTAALVAAMYHLGSYLPSAVYLAWMMRRHGGYGWLRSAGAGIVVMVVFYGVLEVWFGIPLAKGRVAELLGLY